MPNLIARIKKIEENTQSNQSRFIIREIENILKSFTEEREEEGAVEKLSQLLQELKKQ